MVASQFRELAHDLLRRNRAIADGEMLWGAANRIILAINLQNGIIPAGRPLRRNTLVRHLDALHQTAPELEDGLSAVGRLHGHFYNSNLTQSQIERQTEETEAFIAALLNLPETLAIMQA